VLDVNRGRNWQGECRHDKINELRGARLDEPRQGSCGCKLGRQRRVVQGFEMGSLENMARIASLHIGHVHAAILMAAKAFLAIGLTCRVLVVA
jgi:hypothetical protein